VATIPALALKLPRYRVSKESLGSIYEAASQLTRSTYDVLHCQFGVLAPMVLLLRQLGFLKGKLITSFRDYDATKFLQHRPGFYDEVFAEGDLFITVSQNLRRRLIDLGCDDRAIAVLRRDIDHKKFAYVENMLTEPLKVVSVARLVEKKASGTG
jgi:colanic acid/amylovoran biosynthesis glycosyltransferase